MRLDKMKNISLTISKPFDLLLSDLYINNNMSSIQISEYFFQKTNIFITPRSVQRQLKKLNLTRPLNIAFNLAIQTGRKSYAHLKKPIKSSLLRRGINLKARYAVLQRDGSRCVICGKTTKDDILVVDHIIPVVKGGTNDLNNLQTLCRECNHGKMLLNEHL